MITPGEEKAALRMLLKQRRLQMTSEQIDVYSKRVVAKLVRAVDWQAIERMHVYVPLENMHEVNTWPLLKYVWQHWPNIITATPVPEKAYSGESLRIDQQTEWVFGTGAPRPRDAQIIPEGIPFDLIIVPLLGFDAKRFRLGYGGGYYDRFLDAQPQALTAGLAFDCCYMRSLPHESHDIPLKWIVTERQTFTSTAA